MEKEQSDQMKEFLEKGADIAREQSLPNDGHDKWEWKTKYEGEAWKKIKREAIYLTVLLFLGIAAVVVVYFGLIDNLQKHTSTPDLSVFHKQLYCVLFGFLGGTVYGIKILYKAVARGQWHRDRLLWRLFTPWVSLVFSVVVASMMASSIIGKSAYVSVVIGFFAGYFSESAIGKLYAIANFLFN